MPNLGILPVDQVARADTNLAAMTTGPLGTLSHDEVGVVFEALATPLEPHVAVALASTCYGLRAPTAAALKELKRRHEAVKALCAKESEVGAGVSPR